MRCRSLREEERGLCAGLDPDVPLVLHRVNLELHLPPAASACPSLNPSRLQHCHLWGQQSGQTTASLFYAHSEVGAAWLQSEARIHSLHVPE